MRRRARHAAALLFAALGASVALAACRDVVSGGEVDAIQALCEKLEACYGPEYGCEGLRAAVESGSEGDVAAFLERVSGRDCQASCTDARSCLDTEPLCDAPGERCDRDDACCGFASSEATCESESGEDGADDLRCCRPDGFLCDENTVCCAGTCDGGRCGGVVCQEVDAPCRSSFDCCSRYCVDEDGDGDERCAVRLCRNVGETCASDDDCCQDVLLSGVVQQLACDEGACAPRLDPVCGREGTACTQDDDCCSGVCFPNEDPTSDIQFAGSCAGDDACAPLGVDCAADGDCCQHGGGGDGIPPLSCDFTGVSPRCIVNPTCGDDLSSCCAIEGAACGESADCCSGVCEGQVCQPGGQTCAAVACHAPCATGAPMDGACDEVGSCIAAVVAADPYCGCVEWDFTCVVGFLDSCEGTPGCG